MVPQNLIFLNAFKKTNGRESGLTPYFSHVKEIKYLTLLFSLSRQVTGHCFLFFSSKFAHLHVPAPVF